MQHSTRHHSTVHHNISPRRTTQYSNAQNTRGTKPTRGTWRAGHDSAQARTYSQEPRASSCLTPGCASLCIPGPPATVSPLRRTNLGANAYWDWDWDDTHSVAHMLTGKVTGTYTPWHTCFLEHAHLGPSYWGTHTLAHMLTRTHTPWHTCLLGHAHLGTPVITAMRTPWRARRHSPRSHRGAGTPPAT